MGILHWRAPGSRRVAVGRRGATQLHQLGDERAGSPRGTKLWFHLPPGTLYRGL